MVAKRSFSSIKFDKLVAKYFKNVNTNIINEKKINGIEFFDEIKSKLEEKYKDLLTVNRIKSFSRKEQEKDKRFHISIYLKNDIIYTQTIPLIYENNLISLNYSSMNIGSLKNLYDFIDEYLIKIEEEVRVAQKKNKVKKLKTNATLAKIEDLASELQFSYIIVDEYVSKVKLIVKFEKSLAVEIDVTISKYKEILDNLKELILSIRKLQELGIKTRWKSTNKYNQSSWINPKPLSKI